MNIKPRKVPDRQTLENAYLFYDHLVSIKQKGASLAGLKQGIWNDDVVNWEFRIMVASPTIVVRIRVLVTRQKTPMTPNTGQLFFS